MRGYSRVNPIYTLRGLGAPSRPNNAVNRGMYQLPYYSAIPLPTLPNVAQAHQLAGVPHRRRRMRGSPRTFSMNGLGQTAAVPPGTVLQYTFSEGLLNWASGTVTSIAALIALVQQALTQGNLNLSVLNSQDTSGLFSVGGVITVQAGGGGFAQAADVKSILDGVLTNLNYPPASSSISVIQTAGAPGVLPNAAPTPTTSTVTSWLSANWPYLALGAAGVYIAKDFI